MREGSGIRDFDIPGSWNIIRSQETFITFDRRRVVRDLMSVYQGG